MKRITSRFVMLIATAAVAPLVLYGLVSITRLRDGTQKTVTEGNRNVAKQAADTIAQYITYNAKVMQSLGAELRGTELHVWQQNRILKNHVLDFPEFRELSLFDAAGRVVATSRIAAPRLAVPVQATVPENGVYIAPINTDDDLLPTTQIAIRLGHSGAEGGWLLGELSLEQLWRMVGTIRVGNQGYAALRAEDGRLVAHGAPDERRHIAGGLSATADRFAALEGKESATYRDQQGREILGVVAPVGWPAWTVIVEQPTEEAYQATKPLERQLFVAIALALISTVVLGWVWGRSFITRIFALTKATRALAEGRMDERVALSGKDEIRELANSFNSMADKLVELQEDVRKQERQAMFGRIAAGLVHDLSHPIQNIGNSCKLILKMFEDMEYRETFKRTVDREMVVVKRVLDDLRNIARPIPLERFPVDINRSVSEVVESMQEHSRTAGVTLHADLSPDAVFIDGDLFALGRVYRNLIINAIQATAPGGNVGIAIEARDNRVQVRVSDTGCGIPPDRIGAIFEDFVTTKRRGLGLGLAISKKIVEQLGGQIAVTSEVGKGTTFVLDFPRTKPRPLALAAG
jgi:signal transduction histidine kinase